MANRFLFLDLDGVLRRSTSPLYALDADLVANLESLLRAFSDVRVVITSTGSATMRGTIPG